MKFKTALLLACIPYLLPACGYRYRGIPPDPALIENFSLATSQFLTACLQNSGESVPSRPVSANHLYIFDTNTNVVGAWGFTIFDDYKGWLNIYKSQAEISIIKDLNEVEPGPGRYVLKRTVIDKKTIGQYTYRGGHQELTDTSSGAVVAWRTNYYFGNDFARGISCLDSNWKAGFDSFILRSVGFSPGFPRSDRWVREIPKIHIKGEHLSQKNSDPVEFKAPILPADSIYNYNDRRVVIDGVSHYLRQTFNNEPLKMVGVQIFPRRTLIAYQTHPSAPSIIFQIRHRFTSQLLQEVYVNLPPPLHRYIYNSWFIHPLRISKDGITLKNGKIHFEVIQGEVDESEKNGKYTKHSISADWTTEDLLREDLPDHLANAQYGSFALASSDIGNTILPSHLIGRWISYPSRAIWEFKEDNSIIAPGTGTRFIWSVEGGKVLVRERDPHPNKEKIDFRYSKDRSTLELTMGNVAGTYEPFLITRIRE